MSILCSMLGATFASAPATRTAKTITPFDNTQVDTAQKKFGNASMLLDGSTDWLDVTTMTTDTPLTSNFTFECFVRFAALPASNAFQMFTSGGGNRYFALYNNAGTNVWEIGVQGTGAAYYQRWNVATLATGTWYHLAFVKTGASLQVYQDGVARTSVFTSGTMTSDHGLFADSQRIGAFSTGAHGFNGHMDEIRVSNIARYSTGFTPTTTAFTNDADTTLLIHANGLLASTTFTDDNDSTPVSSISFQASATSTATTITVPATAAEGDIAILFDTSTTVTNTFPSGWTSILGRTTTGLRTNISYKILASGDPSSSITGIAGAARKVMLVYRTDVPIVSAIPQETGSQATVNVPTAQNLVGEDGPMIAFAAYASTGAIATRGWSVGSPTEYSSVSTNGIYVKELITNSGTPTTTSITMSDGGTNTLQSFRIKLS